MSDDAPGAAPDGPWARPFWTPGGDDAFVYLVVFGADAERLDITTEHHRVDEIPEGLDAHALDASWVAKFLDSPIGDEVQATDPETTAAALASRSCVVLTGTVADPPTLDYLRNAVGIATAGLDAGGVAVLNLPTFRLYPAAQWRTDVFDGAAGTLAPFATTLVSGQDDPDAVDPAGPFWVHTRGLRTFGRPDLSVHDVAAGDLDLVVRLCGTLVDQLGRGLVIADDMLMEIGGDVGTLHFARRGHLDDPDFNNEHLEITMA
jgi:hypothetical protein